MQAYSNEKINFNFTPFRFIRQYQIIHKYNFNRFSYEPYHTKQLSSLVECFEGVLFTARYSKTRVRWMKCALAIAVAAEPACQPLHTHHQCCQPCRKPPPAHHPIHLQAVKCDIVSDILFQALLFAMKSAEHAQDKLTIYDLLETLDGILER